MRNGGLRLQMLGFKTLNGENRQGPVIGGQRGVLRMGSAQQGVPVVSLISLLSLVSSSLDTCMMT